MRLTTEAHVTIPRPRAEVFDHLVQDEALVRYCLKRGPFAAIENVATAGPLRVGALRQVRMSDGMALEETITEWSVPECHGYQWSDPPKPLGLLVKRAHGLWLFEAISDGATRVTWRYTLTFHSPLFYPVAKALLFGFRGWMQASLDNAQAGL
ncbi:MAG: hypothetical protein ACI9KE_003987 [Polyangiales bacterium]|jgi:uncharacterized protein YndB with AHSA1/START domain